MSATMGLSGGESMAAAANIFVGQTEAPLVIRPYVARMTQSELNALMTGGFATIAGSVMAVYMQILGPQYAPHLMTASVMSAPASFVIAKLVRPETEVSETAGRVELKIERTAGNVIEAAANGTSDGLRLWLNVIAMLIAFVALVGFVNWPLGWLGEQLHVENGLSLERLFGWVLAPVAWVMGVEGWHDCQLFGGLLGTMVSTNEFVAYTHLQTLEPGSGNAIVFESTRSVAMATYALCGFASFASIGIQIGGISALAPERKADLSRLALRAMIGGAFACWMTATIAGLFLEA
jgi:CNT family concentrative nucleoside transporter